MIYLDWCHQIRVLLDEFVGRVELHLVSVMVPAA